MTAADHFTASLARASLHGQPWRHWLLEESYPADLTAELEALPYALPTGIAHDGRREVNNATRVFLDPEQQEKHPCVARLVAAMLDPDVIAAIETACDIDLTDTLLRLEYCMDVGDFWLEPHTDIAVKKYTQFLYLSAGADGDTCGTDLLSPEPPHPVAAEAPFGFNKGTVFVPASDTWHGFRKRRIAGVRKSIIVNYVTSDWRARHELAADRPVK